MIFDNLYFIYALCAFVAVLFLLWPFLVKEREDEQSNILFQVNKDRVALYSQQLEELNNDLNNNYIEQSDFDVSTIELKKRLLNEIVEEGTRFKHINKKVIIGIGVVFIFSFSTVFYYFNGSHRQVEYFEDAKSNVAALGKRVVLQQGAPLTVAEMQQFALGLRAKLAEKGDDATGWMLFGRTMLALEEYNDALTAFEKSYNLNPNNTSLLINYSQTLILQRSESSLRRAGLLLSRVVSIEPSNYDALSLKALVSYNLGNDEEAKEIWTGLLTNYPKNDSRHKFIADKLNEIAVLSQSKISPQPLSQAVGAGIGESTNESNSLKIAISVNETLKSNVPIGGQLFVFAQHSSGQKVPLAVVKLDLNQFPVLVELTDKNAMIEGMNLSSATKVQVTARISVDDKVDVSPGELQGISPVIVLPNRELINIDINTTL